MSRWKFSLTSRSGNHMLECPTCGTQQGFTGGRPQGFVADNALPETFEVMNPLVRSPTTREELRIMRARYLFARDA